MLLHLKIIWQFHAHPVHQKVSRYIGDDFFLGPNLVSFNRAVVPYEISKVNFRVETKILVSICQKRFNKLKNINISKTSQQNDFYYTQVPGFSGIRRTREGTRLQDHLCALC